MGDIGVLAKTLLLLLVSSLCCGVAVDAQCRTIIYINTACVVEPVDPDATCNFAIKIYEDCPVDSILLTFQETGFAVVCERFKLIGDDSVGLATGLDAESGSDIDCPSFITEADIPDVYALVTVVDVDEFYPVVDVGTTTSVNVKENNALGEELLKFSVSDQDRNEAATMEFRPNFDTNQFKLTKGTCTANECPFTLTVEVVLDYEAGMFYDLTSVFTTSDARGNSSSTSLTVLLFVDDEPDSPPFWSLMVPSANVEESDNVVEDVFQVLARDRDTSINNDISYEIISGNDAGLFIINPGTGSVSTTGPIDREALASTFFNLEIRATEVLTDGSIAPLPNNVTQITILQILDVNDNSPEFIETEVTMPIDEMTDQSSPGGSVTVTLRDLDLGDAGKFNIETNDPDHFTATPASGSGQLTVTLRTLYVDGDNIFDYERADGVHELSFTVTATEVEDPTHKNELVVTVTISDVNDNAPVFSEADAYTEAIRENTAAEVNVLTVSATDNDVSEEFGTPSIRYSLQDCQSYLSIDKITGAVATTVKLDYEQTPALLCTVIARDQDGTGDQTDSVLLNITIEDVNDEVPELTAQATAEVLENATLGSVVLRVTAFDPDTAADVQFLLQFPDGMDETIKGWFTINAVDCDDGESVFCGDVTVVNELDREMLTQPYEVVVTVLAVDQQSETGTQTDTADVTITILDVNDVTPVFCDNCAVGLSVEEGAQDGTAIAMITAIDPDEEDQGTLTFSCSENGKVDINSTTGLLFVLDGTAIDREENDIITVTLTVTDMADHSTSLDVTLAVKDINDNPPVLDEELCLASYVVMEDQPTGYMVLQLEASDLDIGAHGNQTYVLQNDILTSGINPITPFVVSPSGLVTVYENDTLSKELDRESFASWILRIRVYDSCGEEDFTCRRQMDECEITVTVGDINDVPPLLLRPLTLYAGEELVKGDNVPDSVITAFDGDELNTTATEIHYTVVGFQASDGQDLDIPFTAQDFSQLNNQLLMEWSCRLVTTKNLANMTGIYTLLVDATDGTLEDPVNTNTISVTMEITDYNDNVPVIVLDGCLAQYNHIITITEETYFAGDFIPCVDAQTSAAQLSYRDDDAQSPNNKALLDIDYDNSMVDPPSYYPGQLYDFELRQMDEVFELYLKEDMVGNLSLVNGKSYNLSIVATDLGTPPLIATPSWIFVNLTSKSTYDPAFCTEIEDCFATTYITENSRDIGKFPEAWDFDNIGDYTFNIIYYHVIYDPSGCFAISNADKTTPELTPTCDLDREPPIGSGDYYTVLVQATNTIASPTPAPSGDPVSTDMLQVNVTIMDVNDNAPSFPGTVIFGTVIQTGSAGQDAALLEANDPDLNETLSYEFEGGFAWTPSASYGTDVFQIINDGEVGTVKLTQSPSTLKGYCIVSVVVFDKEETGSHHNSTVLQIFIVEASDQVPFYFENDIETLTNAEEDIKFALRSVFPFEPFIDSMNPTVGTDNTARDSVLAVHFVNDSNTQRDTDAPGNLVERSVITSMASSGRLSTVLQQELEKYGLQLYRIGDSVVEGTQDLEQQLLTYQIVLGVVAMLLGSLVFLLLAAYIVRTTKLERRVKVLSTNTFGSKASDLDKTGLHMDVIPNSNLFKGEGANPMFNTSFKEFDRQDSGSMSSGDSVLVGVEDNPEFRDYTGGVRPSLGNTKDNNPIVASGGMTSSNPLFANMDKKKEGGDKGSDDDTVSSSDDAQSQEAGDLGVTNSNFSFM